MQIVETLVYLLGIMGIIFTSIMFIEICNMKNYSTYKLFSNNPLKKKRAEITINFENFEEEEEEEIIDILLKGEYSDLEKVVDTVKIVRE